MPKLRSRPGTGSAQLPGRLREGQVACKELSGRQCCGSVRGARRAEALLAAAAAAAAAARGARAGDVKSGEERNEAARRQRARREAAGARALLQPAPRARRARAPQGRVCARGLAAARGPRSAARPPARRSARLARARLSLPLASARLLGSPAGVATFSSSPATAVVAAAIQDAHFHFLVGDTEDPPCNRPGEIASGPGRRRLRGE